MRVCVALTYQTCVGACVCGANVPLQPTLTENVLLDAMVSVVAIHWPETTDPGKPMSATPLEVLAVSLTRRRGCTQSASVRPSCAVCLPNVDRNSCVHGPNGADSYNNKVELPTITARCRCHQGSSTAPLAHSVCCTSSRNETERSQHIVYSYSQD